MSNIPILGLDRNLRRINNKCAKLVVAIVVRSLLRLYVKDLDWHLHPSGKVEVMVPRLMKMVRSEMKG